MDVGISNVVEFVQVFCVCVWEESEGSEGSICGDGEMENWSCYKDPTPHKPHPTKTPPYIDPTLQRHFFFKETSRYRQWTKHGPSAAYSPHTAAAWTRRGAVGRNSIPQPYTQCHSRSPSHTLTHTHTPLLIANRSTPCHLIPEKEKTPLHAWRQLTKKQNNSEQLKVFLCDDGSSDCFLSNHQDASPSAGHMT